MSYKILITISDDLKAMIDNYNRENPFEPLHISEISARAIFEKITSLDEDIAMEKTEVMKVSKKESNEKEERLCDINIEHYTDKLERMVDRSAHSEPELLHKALTPIHENIHKLHSETILEPIPDNIPELIRAPIPVHENIHKLHSEQKTEAEELACEADLFGKECDTIEKTEEEPVHGIQTYRGKKGPTLKQCEVCGKIFHAQTKRAVTCSPNCRKVKSREKGKENSGKK